MPSGRDDMTIGLLGHLPGADSGSIGGSPGRSRHRIIACPSTHSFLSQQRSLAIVKTPKNDRSSSG